MNLKIIWRPFAFVGASLFTLAAICRPALLAKREVERRINNGEISCPRCGGGDIRVTIVPCMHQPSLPIACCGEDWFLNSANEQIKLICRGCGAIM